jgi:hypothetical protein
LVIVVGLVLVVVEFPVLVMKVEVVEGEMEVGEDEGVFMMVVWLFVVVAEAVMGPELLPVVIVMVVVVQGTLDVPVEVLLGVLEVGGGVCGEGGCFSEALCESGRSCDEVEVFSFFPCLWRSEGGPSPGMPGGGEV